MGQIILITPENLSKNFEEVYIQVQQGAIVKLIKDGMLLHMVKDYDIAMITSTQNVNTLQKVRRKRSLKRSVDTPNDNQIKIAT